jgi:hypothetical protein
LHRPVRAGERLELALEDAHVGDEDEQPADRQLVREHAARRQPQHDPTSDRQDET